MNTDLLIKEMNKLDGIKLEPLFYSEINSSFILKSVLEEDKIASDFIKHFLGIEVTVLTVSREQPYTDVGSIDLFIRFKDARDRKCALIIEVKVHDYLSATKDQINRYYEAVTNDNKYQDVYLIYLTQFNDKNLQVADSISRPNTLTNFESLLSAYPNKSDHFEHINWIEVHTFLDKHIDQLSPELKLMLYLQKIWILKQIDHDKEGHKVRTGKRQFADLFDGLDPRSIFPELKSHNQKGKEKLDINMLQCTRQELDDLFTFIVDVTSSASLISKHSRKSNANTIEAAKRFLEELSNDPSKYKILGFYAKLFDYVLATDHIQLNGTGRMGFSIIADHVNIGKISICTILAVHKLSFSLVR